MSEPRSYRFADSARPGLILGLSMRQALPVIVGVLVLAVTLQTPLPPYVGAIGPVIGVGLAFGRWRGAPLAETLVPGVGLWTRRRTGRARWMRPSLVGDNDGRALPRPLRGLDLLEDSDRSGGVVHDRIQGTVTAVMRVRGSGFPLASAAEQDTMLDRWGSALSPLAREQSPVAQVVWQEWAHPVTSDDHHAFLAEVGIAERHDSAAAVDYLALVDQQSPVTIAHEVLVAVTVDLRRVRARRTTRSRLAAAVDALLDETRLFTARLDSAGLTVEGPLNAIDISAAARIRSDPGRAAQVTTLARSLAAAARRGALEWGPMAVEATWGHVRVDGSYHRSYRAAGWPRLPVAGDWLSGLIADTNCVRTVTVVAEPVPMGRAARAADREVMTREADADMKSQKGFRVNARERKRLADAERRERELSEGHAEFAFAGIVTVTAADLDQLDDDCAEVEQAAAGCLLDLRPLDARHDQGWVAALPFGRVVARQFTP
ncbi:MAG TPA: SCO6880 family protein [Ilumatobacter sp.]|nr:SCO6880 family protein [Ilumatobacter sp.]